MRTHRHVTSGGRVSEFLKVVKNHVDTGKSTLDDGMSITRKRGDKPNLPDFLTVILLPSSNVQTSTVGGGLQEVPLVFQLGSDHLVL